MISRLSILMCLLLPVLSWGELPLERDPSPPPPPPKTQPPARVPPPPDKTAAPLQLKIQLTDGSLILGRPDHEVLAFQSSLGEMKLKFPDIQSIQLAKPQEQWLVRFRNGDQLRGTIGVKAIGLTASFGKVSIPVQHITGITIAAANAALPVTDAIIAYSFDRPDDGRITNSAGEKHPAINRGADWVEDGKRGGAVRFGGRSAGLEIPNDPALNFGQGDFSCAVWFRANKLGATQQIFDHDFNPELQIEPSGVLTVFHAFQFCGRLHSQQPIEPQTWYFVVLTRAGGTGRLYLNGVEDAATDASDCNASKDSSWTIGRNASGGEPFRGSIDEFRLWRRALTADEIRGLYDAER